MHDGGDRSILARSRSIAFSLSHFFEAEPSRGILSEDIYSFKLRMIMV